MQFFHILVTAPPPKLPPFSPCLLGFVSPLSKWLLQLSACSFGDFFGTEFVKFLFFLIYSRYQAAVNSSLCGKASILWAEKQLYLVILSSAEGQPSPGSLVNLLKPKLPKTLGDFELQAEDVLALILSGAKLKVRPNIQSYVWSPCQWPCRVWMPFQREIVISRKLVFYLFFD